ncbi:MAG: FAD binding domain-containing protein [Candidatus Fournierella pullistercoris]|uniref:FAD binding domain-containing protein n=1 Tax=Candidatus Allofournierella pullistercoris TaxID=2838597 RepID=A0A948T2J7_9FIRM|nr:FAD binding domain-containing protein [Candidatus Fournierella pullistercoris]
MYTAQQYVKAESLQQAFELNQKRNTTLLAGGCWLRMTRRRVGTLVDLSALGLDTIEETEDAFILGAMVTLRQLETHKALNETFHGLFREMTRHIVGVQFRNCATLGGSIVARFGFSDLLCALLALDCQVELVGAGLIPLEQYAAMDYDRDVLARIYVKKNGRRAVYQSMRNTKTDLPVLNVAASVLDGQVRVVVGARPARAKVVPMSLPLAAREEQKQQLLEQVQALSYAGNMRAGEAYRRHLASVLTGRCLAALQEG